MINKKFIQKLKTEYVKHDGERRQIISQSNNVLHSSKRIIFALHRGDMERAEKLLAETEEALMALEKKFGFNRIIQEGAYKAGAEEYVEAKMYFRITAGKKVDKVIKIKLAQESYLAGICDLTGEMVRRAINQVSKGNNKEAEEMKEAINQIMAELVEFDFTGYLRTKYDQARSNLRKIEHIIYEIKIRK